MTYVLSVLLCYLLMVGFTGLVAVFGKIILTQPVWLMSYKKLGTTFPLRSVTRKRLLIVIVHYLGFSFLIEN